MPFKKIEASDQEFKEVKRQNEDVYQDFLKFAESISKKDGSHKKSGKAASYARYLIRLVIIYEDKFGGKIGQLDTYEALNKLEKIGNLPGFKKYNQDEGRFPNATLSCFKAYIINKQIIQEELTDTKLNYSLNNLYEREYQDEFLKDDKNLVTGPTKRATPIKSGKTNSYPRNIAESVEAKKKSSYKCEMDPKHKTFINFKDARPFVEAHHLIPMAAQDYFDNTIDFVDNIVTLCPNCHRKIHFATVNEKTEMIKFLYNLREKKFPQYGIEINEKKLMSFYGILKNDKK